MTESVPCPYCGEQVEPHLEVLDGEAQEFVEDCSVCCRPIQFRVRYDEEQADFEVAVFRAN